MRRFLSATVAVVIVGQVALADTIVLKDGRAIGKGMAGYVIETESEYILKSVGRLGGARTIPKTEVAKVEYSFDRKLLGLAKRAQWRECCKAGKKLMSSKDPLAQMVGKGLILLAIKRQRNDCYALGYEMLADAEPDPVKRLAYAQRYLLASMCIDWQMLGDYKAARPSNLPPWKKIAVILQKCDQNDPVGAWSVLTTLTKEDERQIDKLLLEASEGSLVLEKVKKAIGECVTNTVTVEQERTCPKCRGRGKIPRYTTESRTCPTCGGSGKITKRLGFAFRTKKCPRCHGHGEISRRGRNGEQDCPVCGGTGKVKKTVKRRLDHWQKVPNSNVAACINAAAQDNVKTAMPSPPRRTRSTAESKSRPTHIVSRHTAPPEKLEAESQRPDSKAAVGVEIVAIPLGDQEVQAPRSNSNAATRNNVEIAPLIKKIIGIASCPIGPDMDIFNDRLKTRNYRAIGDEKELFAVVEQIIASVNGGSH